MAAFEVLMVSFLSRRTVSGHVLLFFITVLLCLPSSFLSASIWQVTDLALQSAAAVHHLAGMQDGLDANLWDDKNPCLVFCCIVSFASTHTSFGSVKILKIKFGPSLQEMKQSYQLESSRLYQTFYDAINSSPS